MANAEAKDNTKTSAKVTPLPTARGKLDDDAPEANDAAPLLKPKFLPTGLSRAIVTATVIASLAALTSSLLTDRYTMVPAPNSTNGFMYRVDSLTGSILFCGPQSCTPVQTQVQPK